MMNLEVTKTNLLDGLTNVQKGLSGRGAMPILNGVLIEVIGDDISLTTTDTNIRVNSMVKAEGMLNEGKLVVTDGKLLIDIVKKLPDDTIKITQSKDSNNQITIRCKKSEFTMPVQEPDDFPKAPEVKEKHELQISGKELKDLILKSIFSVAADENRVILTGVLFENSNGRLNVVALDGYRLSHVWYNSKNDNNISVVIPAKSLIELSKIIGDENIKMGFSDNFCVFKIGSTQFSTTLLNGDFIKYGTIIPTESTSTVFLNRENFIDCLSRVSLIGKDGATHLSKIQLNETNCSITANSQIGKVSEELDCEIEGEGLTIAFNSRYLIEALKAISSKKVKLNLTTNVSPVLIYPDSNEECCRFLVLPVRLTNN